MPRNRITAHHFSAMGTSCSLFVTGLSAMGLLKAELWVRALAARLTRFDERSELARFNRSAGAWVPVSAALEALLRESLRAPEVGNGLVNLPGLPSLVAA